MSKSFKMLTLLTMLAQNQLPGSISIESLVDGFTQHASKSERLREDFGSATLRNPSQMKSLIEQNPIDAWVGAKGTSGRQYFEYQAGIFKTTFDVGPEYRTEFQDFVRELVDWRLAEYLTRPGHDKQSHTFSCHVRSIQGKPVIALPDRTKVSGIPSGVTQVHCPQGEYLAHFGSDEITSIRREDSSDDELPGLLRTWFGDEYEGKRITLEETNEGFRLRPQDSKSPSVWSSSPRQEIPGQYGFEFNQAIWNSGFVVMPGHVFLLVTLEKGGLMEQHRYLDHFIDRSSFQWQSQNRTKRDSEHGRMISEHRQKNIAVHLYVRARKLLAGKAAPFLYCGEVDFDRWEGDSPITVIWKLRDPVPESWCSELGIADVSLA